MEAISGSTFFVSIEKSNEGNAIVISKEFLGEYFMYKVSIKGEKLRVRTNIKNVLNIGDRCLIGIKKNSFYFLFPGADKIFV